MIRLQIIDGRILIRFPAAVEGLKEWAEQECGAKFDADAPKGWAYVLPATSENAARVVFTSPLVISEASETFRQFASTISIDDLVDFLDGGHAFNPPNLPQPTLRVFDQWAHQLRGYHFAKRRGFRAGLAMGMGTGKSKVAIDAATNEGCGRVLVLCPPSVLGVWRGQFRQHNPAAEVLILDDRFPTAAKKQEAAARFYEASKFAQNRGRMFAVVSNYESAIRPQFAKWSTSNPWDMVICDEVHRAKDSEGVTGKYVNRLRPMATRRLGLSGTFMPHSPADMFSPFRFVDPSVFGDSFYRWKKRYAICGFFGEFLGWRHKEELRKKYHSVAIVIGSDVLDLPPSTHLEREFELPPESLRVYRELWEEFVTETASGVVTVDNALVKLLRAQQITSGFVPLDIETDLDSPPTDSPKQRFEVLNDAKEKLLAELLDDANDDEPVVVFCRYRYDLDAVARVCERIEYERNDVRLGNVEKRAKLIESGAWRPFKCGEVSGRRKDLTNEAKLPTGFSVFAVQEQSGGVGVDFTRASIAVLYSIGFSLGNYEQMLARLVRPGQTRPVRFYHLIARSTVDRRIRKALKDRKRVVDSISEAIKGGTLGDWIKEAK